jgi:hypothetical protein
LTVVTVRTYWNQADAALAKSLLDNYEIFCALIHENANLYGRAPIAMPIRLVVDEIQAQQAIWILRGEPERAAEADTTVTEYSPKDKELPSDLTSRNPWELLMISFYFLLPGLCVLQTEYPTVVGTRMRLPYAIALVSILHLLGWIGILFAISLIVLYAHVRRARHQNG